ncbi:MAG: hypothetical protein Q9191_002047 [Dirinaria sp. TL-2023a]
MGDSQNAIDASSVDDFEDDPRRDLNGQPQSHDPQDQVSSGADSTTPSSAQTVKPTIPMQKRRRVTRACDECRRKKIKCDGKQPCTHCTPSNRRRNPAPQYTEALEIRLERAEALLRTVLPDVNLEDPSLEVGMTSRLQPQLKQEPRENIRIGSIAPAKTKALDSQDRGPESMLESMVDNTGMLDLDDEGHWDFHGTSSGIVFLRCLRDQFGDLMGKAEGYGMPFLKSRKFSSAINSPKSEGSSGTPTDATMPNKEDLPPIDCARLLCQNALDDASFRFNPIESQIRQRIFWAVRKMDIYVGALLGLPMFLNDDDIDQRLPTEIDDEFITSEKILPMPEGRLSLMTAFNAHNRLVDILLKTTKYIYPTKTVGHKPGHSYAVSHGRVREIEQDLQKWMESLPMALRPGGEAPPEQLRIQQLLRMAYAHVQMFLYRPFLHYISQSVQAKFIDKRSYACAAACVSVSRNIIHISAEMKKRGLLNGSYWFYMYTTFFAVLSLVFFVLENPSSPTAKDILHDAHEGRDTLAGLASRSMAADRCSQTLANLFKQLPEKLKGVKTSQLSQRKRQASNIEALESSTPAHNTPKALIKPAPGNRTAVQQKDQNSPSPSVQVSNTTPNQYESPDLRQQAVATAAAVSDYPSSSQEPYSPNSAKQPIPESTANTPTSGTWSASGFHQPTPASLPDLGTVMFPTTDPLAYPNQPLSSTLEERNFARQDDDLLEQNIYNGGNGPSPMGGVYEPMDAQLFGPMPPYLMQGQQSGFDFQPLSPQMLMSTAASGTNVNAPAGNEGDWPMQPIQQSEPAATPALNYGPMFGESWGQWMDQGFNQ